MQKYFTWPLVFIVFYTIFFFYHLYTLDISPIPWSDETFFASMTASYKATGRFNLDIAPFAYKGEILIYGPIYFWITSFFTNLLGFSMFTFRLPALLFAFLSMIVFFKILRLFLGVRISYFTLLVFSLDPLLSSSMHSGRMETVTLFFALLSIYIYFVANSKNDRKNGLLLSFLSGISFSLALLTTPRIGVLLIAFSIIQFYDILKNYKAEKIKQLIVYAISLLSVYLIWVFWRFGSVISFVKYYSNFSEYIGSKFTFPQQQIPLLTITLLSFITGLILNQKKYLSLLVVMSMSSVIIYYLIVNDTGYYSIIISPFQYAIIGSTTSLIYYDAGRNKERLTRFLRFTLFIPLLLFNVSFFTVKLIMIFSVSETRNPKYISSFIKSQIPSKSKVIGDEQYYYAVFLANSDFQYINSFKSDIEREYYQRKIFDYDYIVWSNRLQEIQPQVLKAYQAKSTLVKVAEFKNKNNKEIYFLKNIFFKLGVPMDRSYDCIIYKRIR